jgi:hypothetical protein
MKSEEWKKNKERDSILEILNDIREIISEKLEINGEK